MLQDFSKEVVFVSVHDASQVESLLNVPVVEELVFRVHVEWRSNLVYMVSESFSDSDRSSHRNEHLEIIVIAELIRQTCDVVEVELRHVHCKINPPWPLGWVWLQIFSSDQVLLSRLFLAEERVSEYEELQLDISKRDFRLNLVWSHTKNYEMKIRKFCLPFLAVEEEFDLVTPTAAVENAVPKLQVLIHEGKNWHEGWFVVFVNRPSQGTSLEGSDLCKEVHTDWSTDVDVRQIFSGFGAFKLKQINGLLGCFSDCAFVELPICHVYDFKLADLLAWTLLLLLVAASVHGYLLL